MEIVQKFSHAVILEPQIGAGIVPPFLHKLCIPIPRILDGSGIVDWCPEAPADPALGRPGLSRQRDSC